MRRMKHIAIIFILLISSTLHSAQDTASFEISAYNIGLDSGAPEGSIYIEIGDAVTGGILDSSNKIVIPNIEDMLVDDISNISGGDHPNHNEEIVFSYLIRGENQLTDGDMVKSVDMWAVPYTVSFPTEKYTFTIAFSPFKNNRDNSEFTDFSYRLMNKTASFENGSKKCEVAICTHPNQGHTSINSTFSIDEQDSSHLSSEKPIIQTWDFSYDSCNRIAYDHELSNNNIVPWYIRGAVSLVFDREAYENASAGTYSSTVTLTLKTGN